MEKFSLGYILADAIIKGQSRAAADYYKLAREAVDDGYTIMAINYQEYAARHSTEAREFLFEIIRINSEDDERVIDI